MDRMNGTQPAPPADLLPFEPAWPFEPLAPPPRDTAAPVPTPQRLLGQIAATFDVSVADLTGPSRRSYVSATRQAAAYILHTRFTPLSLRDIGTLLGGRDSSTMFHSRYPITEIVVATRHQPHDLGRYLVPAQPRMHYHMRTRIGKR